MTTFPQNSPDNHSFGHVTTKFTYWTKVREFRVFLALDSIPAPPRTKNLLLVKFRPTQSLHTVDSLDI